MPTWSFRITGKVQGVFYRQSTREKATELGLTGQVWNNTDGTVGIIASGTVPQLEALQAWCQQGPARAKVLSVETSPTTDQNFEDFRILR